MLYLQSGNFDPPTVGLYKLNPVDPSRLKGACFLNP
jgi:hypothetical protein